MIIFSFIIQANVVTIINYDRKTFIVQATILTFVEKEILSFKVCLIYRETLIAVLGWQLCSL
jgi:hypothetical protein